ncbi:Sec-independent protein translocase protein TatB [Endozoicomonas sp. Mp262]|uniref:Sec-independent protein translocase protein TatB n=1 Tax=Endozoicomonas sp. Mp262 TaxID=2919499 RepID=UPI0021D7E53D
MLDIGFTELLLVAAIALVVLGPERLPQAIKVTAYWVGKIRRSFQSVKEELEREIGADEIKRQLHNEAVMGELNKARNKLQSELRDLKEAAQLNTPAKEAERVSQATDSAAEHAEIARQTDAAMETSAPGKGKL